MHARMFVLLHFSELVLPVAFGPRGKFLYPEGKKKSREAHGEDRTKEKREEFEIIGAKAWEKIEEMRREWEDVLGVNSGK